MDLPVGPQFFKLCDGVAFRQALGTSAWPVLQRPRFPWRRQLRHFGGVCVPKVPLCMRGHDCAQVFSNVHPMAVARTDHVGADGGGPGPLRDRGTVPARVEPEGLPEGRLARDAHHHACVPCDELQLQRGRAAAAVDTRRNHAGTHHVPAAPQRRWREGAALSVALAVLAGGGGFFHAASAVHSNRHQRVQCRRPPKLVRVVRVAPPPADTRAGATAVDILSPASELFPPEVTPPAATAPAERASFRPQRRCRRRGCRGRPHLAVAIRRRPGTRLQQ